MVDKYLVVTRLLPWMGHKIRVTTIIQGTLPFEINK